MISALFDQPGYAAAKRMMDATALRHEAIASNIANLETPNYKRVDINDSFQQALASAVASKDSKSISNVPLSIVQDQTAMAANRDGNTVQLEKEMLALNQNTLAHALETQLVSGSLLKMRLAITGRS